MFKLANKVKNHKIFVTKIYFDELKEQEIFKEYNFVPSNVVYCYGKGPYDTYFVDDCDGEKINVIPPTPYKYGFEFLGWYKDKEYNHKWDFDSDIVPKKEYDEEGNYIFKETKIYAIWR